MRYKSICKRGKDPDIIYPDLADLTKGENKLDAISSQSKGQLLSLYPGSLATPHSSYPWQQISNTRQSNSLQLETSRTFNVDGVEELQCPYCMKMFATKCGLRDHVKKHEGDFRYRCNICAKGFQMNDHFEGHMNSHMGHRPYCCNYCGRNFSYKGSLTSHAKNCSGRT